MDHLIEARKPDEILIIKKKYILISWILPKIKECKNLDK